MAGDLQAGFSNNKNVVTIREAGNTGKVYTDHTAIDLDGDGSVEQVTLTVTELAGNKVKNVVTEPDGSPRTPVKRITETDGGVDTTGSEFTEGVE